MSSTEIIFEVSVEEVDGGLHCMFYLIPEDLDGEEADELPKG